MANPTNAEVARDPARYGFLAAKVLDDGRLAAVILLMFGRARLTVGRDKTGYDDGW